MPTVMKTAPVQLLTEASEEHFPWQVAYKPVAVLLGLHMVRREGESSLDSEALLMHVMTTARLGRNSEFDETLMATFAVRRPTAV